MDLGRLVWEGKREWGRARVTVETGERIKCVEWVGDRLIATCYYPAPLDAVFKVSSPILLSLKYQIAY